jgi:hypothetical protein
MMQQPGLTEVVWTKSSFSNGGTTCVELARTPARVAVRDSKVSTGPVLVFPEAACVAFLAATI